MDLAQYNPDNAKSEKQIAKEQNNLEEVLESFKQEVNNNCNNMYRNIY